MGYANWTIPYVNIVDLFITFQDSGNIVSITAKNKECIEDIGEYKLLLEIDDFESKDQVEAFQAAHDLIETRLSRRIADE